jgi:L-asparaginase/beta-aspartyl-peptidase (threonine type)
MEDSGVFNAGTGSVLRFDGRSIQMDAVVAVSDESGVTQGAVEIVEDVRNPVLLAAEVMKTPHVKLGGDGAVQFARRLGLPRHPGPSKLAIVRHQRLLRLIGQKGIATAAPGWTREALAAFLDWDDQAENGDSETLASVAEGCDTVGAVALDAFGRFALAASTGGMSVMLRGRIGDVPVRGAGFQIGPFGGVLATGIGEEIIRLEGSDKVYQLIQLGLHPQQACEQAVQLFDPTIPAGFIALTKDALGVASNRDMPSYPPMEKR